MKPYNPENKNERAIFEPLYRSYIKELSRYSKRLSSDELTADDMEALNTNSLLKRYFITNEANEIIGFLLIGYKENTQPGTDWYIQELCVHPKHRRQGYGTKAIEEFIANHQDKRKYCYFVLKENLNAITFWNKFKTTHNCKDITEEYDATPYTPNDSVFQAFEYQTPETQTSL